MDKNHDPDNSAYENKEMPIRDNLFLSPIEKYKFYGRFPWKMIIHLLLVILTTTQIVLVITSTTRYTRSQERVFYNYFLSDDDKTGFDYQKKLYIYTVSDLVDHLNISMQNFVNLKENSIERIEYEMDTEDLFSFLEFKFIENKQHPSDYAKNYIYKINATSLGPFDKSETDIKQFLNTVTEFRVNYTLKTFIPFYYADNMECFNWNIIQIYSFSERAHFSVKLNINRITCGDENLSSIWDTFVNKLMWLHILVIIFSFVSLLLTWRYVYKIAKLYWRIKNKFKGKKKKDDPKNPDNKTKVFQRRKSLTSNKDKTKHSEEEEDEFNVSHDEGYNHPIVSSIQNKKFKKIKENQWNVLRISDKKKFFNMWSIISLLGNIVQIFGSVLSLFDSNNTMASTEILVGFGCMLAYINIGRYLEYNREYSTIFATIKRALPNVLRYLLGVMPIFFGFIFFGLCMFWRSERFVSTSGTMITLFSMLNGDSIFDIFNDLTGVSFFVGQIYCYMFCIMFIVVVMNVFISIIEEAYVSIKMKSQNHWIYSYLKIDPKYVEINKENEKENLNKTGNQDKKEDQSRYSKMNSMSKSLVNTADQLYDKNFEKMMSKVNSKNMLRDILLNNDNTNKNRIRPGEKSKEELEKILDTYFKNIEYCLNQVDNITKDLSKSDDSVFKDELRLFIFDNFSNLENKILGLRNMWMKNY